MFKKGDLVELADRFVVGAPFSKVRKGDFGIIVDVEDRKEWMEQSYIHWQRLDYKRWVLNTDLKLATGES